MQYAKLGKTDIEVSRVAMGCWAIAGGGTWGPQDENDAIEAIQAALEAGINFFDTAEGYGRGRSEELLGKALGARRREAVIATKASPRHLRPDALRAACERSLQYLGTDYIDLYQIHWPSREIGFEETAEGMERLREEGKIRAVGVSNFGPQDLQDYLRVGRCETNQVAYSLLWRSPEFALTAACEKTQVGILAYSPLCHGLLTGKFATADDVPEGRARSRHFAASRPQTRHGEPGCEAETFATLARLREIAAAVGEPMGRLALAWLLQQPAVTSVLAGGRNRAQVEENAQAAEVALSAAQTAELAAAAEELKQKLGPNMDMWESDSRIR